MTTRDRREVRHELPVPAVKLPLVLAKSEPPRPPCQRQHVHTAARAGDQIQERRSEPAARSEHEHAALGPEPPLVQGPRPPDPPLDRRSPARGPGKTDGLLDDEVGPSFDLLVDETEVFGDHAQHDRQHAEAEQSE